MHCVEFKVIDTEPSPYCIVAPETVICCEGTPIERQLEEASIDEIDFDDIGGLEDIKQCLKEFIQYPFQYEEIYHRFGMAPSRGVLLYGPPGCGNFFFLLYLKS
jgi:transitional endoplasmic reticulum ATPase